jgi:hypothetical protein
MTKRTSTSYVFTADINSADDMLKIEDLRKLVKITNRGQNVKKRVVLRGRKPLVKKEVYNMWTGERATRSYDFGGNIVGGIANATKLDVYIYDRS